MRRDVFKKEDTIEEEPWMGLDETDVKLCDKKVKIPATLTILLAC